MRLLLAAMSMGWMLACHQPQPPPVPPTPTNPTNRKIIGFQRAEVIDASIVSDGSHPLDAAGFNLDGASPAR
jgi:hypothetical protein